VNVFQRAEKEHSIQIPRDDKLALKIMYERSLKEKSFWNDYIPMIPKDYTNTIFWNDQELLELQGSNLYPISQTLKQQVQEDYIKLLGLFHAFPDVFPLEDFTIDIYKWALATIWSRTFDIEVKFPDEMTSRLARVLPPFADLFNHDPLIDTSHRFNPKTSSLECTTNVGTEAEKQIFFNYGAFPNHKLLRLYGFAIPNNPFDAVELYCPMSEQAPMFQYKISVLQKNAISNTQSFELTIKDPLPEKLLFTLRVQRLEEKLPADYKNGMINISNEFAVLESLFEGIKGMLQGYATSQQEDEKLLSSNSNFKQTCAVILRHSEKNILAAVVKKLEERLVNLKK